MNLASTTSSSYDEPMVFLKRIDHTTLFVADLDGFEKHIQAVTGCEVSRLEDDNNVSLFEQGDVHFFAVEVPAGDIPKDQHLSFEVSDLEALQDRLNALDVPFETGTFTKFKFRNYRWCEWKIADNVRLEGIELI